MKAINRELSPKLYLQLPDSDQRLRFLTSFGALAPSSHNTQPWLFRLGSNSIELYGNPERTLPGSDPQKREFYISLGACLGTLRVAAEGYGLRYSVEAYNPEQPMRIARLVFDDLTPHKIDYPQLEALVSRHTNRFPFTEQDLPDPFLEFAKGLGGDGITVHVVTDSGQKQKIAAVVGDAIEAAFKQESFTKELAQWIRPSFTRYKDGMPGYNIAVPWFMSLFMPWMIRHLPMSKQQRAMNEPLLTRAAAFIVITADRDIPASWIRVGEIFCRIAVEAEKQGIKIGVQAAPIEIGEFYRLLGGAIATQARPEMFFRLGYTSVRPTPSPRLAAQELTIKN